MTTEQQDAAAPNGVLTEALSHYANPYNWSEDDNGIRRRWCEPGSYTPTAYNGFELARAALERYATQPTPPAVVEPLTDAEIEEIYWGELDNRTLSFARAIEAAHGIGIKKEDSNA